MCFIRHIILSYFIYCQLFLLHFYQTFNLQWTQQTNCKTHSNASPPGASPGPRPAPFTPTCLKTFLEFGKHHQRKCCKQHLLVFFPHVEEDKLAPRMHFVSPSITWLTTCMLWRSVECTSFCDCHNAVLPPSGPEWNWSSRGSRTNHLNLTSK